MHSGQQNLIAVLAQSIKLAQLVRAEDFVDVPGVILQKL